MKKLILVTSPPACGKTFVTKKLAKANTQIVGFPKTCFRTKALNSLEDSSLASPAPF